MWILAIFAIQTWLGDDWYWLSVTLSATFLATFLAVLWRADMRKKAAASPERED